MSFRKDWEAGSGAVIAGACWVIEEVLIAWQAGTLYAKLRIYAGQAEYEAGRPPLADPTFVVPLIDVLGRIRDTNLAGVNDALHEALAALPDFDGAERIETTPPA